MYIHMRRRKAAKLAEAKTRVKDLTRDLALYDGELRKRGIDAIPCDVCDNLNWFCGECGAMTCRTECPRCGHDTERMTGHAMSD